MSKIAVIRTGGKQYLVKEGDILHIEKLPQKEGEKVEFETLAIYDLKTGEAKIGQPTLKEKVKGELLEQLKGDKIRVARFKAKVRYRKVKGHRQMLSTVKITKI